MPGIGALFTPVNVLSRASITCAIAGASALIFCSMFVYAFLAGAPIAVERHLGSIWPSLPDPNRLSWKPGAATLAA